AASASCCGSSSARPTDANSAQRTPSENSPARRTATSSARRVLPLPPGPVRVTSRSEAASARTATISASRPTKVVRGVGRRPEGARAGPSGALAGPEGATGGAGSETFERLIELTLDRVERKARPDGRYRERRRKDQ